MLISVSGSGSPFGIGVSVVVILKHWFVPISQFCPCTDSQASIALSISSSLEFEVIGTSLPLTIVGTLGFGLMELMVR